MPADHAAPIFTPPPILNSADECNAKWIEDALRASGVIRAGDENHVVEIAKSSLGDGGATGATVLRIVLTYATVNPDLPSSVVLKFSDTSKIVTPVQRPSAVERGIMTLAGFNDVRMLVLETSFYSTYGPIITSSCGMEFPRCYYSGFTGSSSVATRAMFVLFKRLERANGCILMQDMSNGTIYDAVEDISLDVATKIAVALAKLHAVTAKEVQSRSTKYLPVLGRAFNYDMNSMSTGLPKLVKGTAFGPRSSLASNVKKIWGTSDLRVLVDEPDVFDALCVFVKKNKQVARQLKRRHPFKCILHGDGHAGNCMFLPDGSIKFFDWQMWGYGHPAQELAQFFISNIPNDREFELSVLRAYSEELNRGLENSNLSYAFDDLTRDVEVAQLDVLAAEMFRFVFILFYFLCLVCVDLF